MMARCISCGCTDEHACMVSYGGNLQGCAWILVDRERGEGLCSACATLPQLVYATLREGPAEGMTVRELADYVTVSDRRVLRALRDLEGKELVERCGMLAGGGYVWQVVRA